MKKLFVILAACLALLAVSSCSSEGPLKVAEDFSAAFYTADFEKAATYCTEDGASILTVITTMMPSEIKEKMKASNPKVSVDGLSFDADNKNEATVRLKISNYIDSKSGKLKTEPTVEELDMVSEDGVWKVNIHK